MLHSQVPSTINSQTENPSRYLKNCNFIYLNACLPHQQHQFSILLPLLTVACEICFNYFLHFCIIFHSLFCCCIYQTKKRRKIKENVVREMLFMLCISTKGKKICFQGISSNFFLCVCVSVFHRVAIHFAEFFIVSFCCSCRIRIKNR